MKRAAQGWTLIELLIALSIAALLSGIAQSQYRQQQLRSQRGLATRSLLQLALRQDDYQLRHGHYASDFASLLQIDAAQVYVAENGSLSATATPRSPYKISFVTGSDIDAGVWRLQVTAIGPQIKDTRCNSWTLDARGRKTASGDGLNALRDCWP